MPNMTPMMRQYFSIKAKHKDCLLFFRLGDFYEMFGDDARLASGLLGLTLTTRDRAVENADERMPMCGVPHHSATGYIAKLIAAGHKVAVCEQTEDPATAKGLVSRDVVRIVTPGTLLDGDMMDEASNNYIAAVYNGLDSAGVCFADISTGTAYTARLSGTEEVKSELARFNPKEIIETTDFTPDDGADRPYDPVAYAFGDKMSKLLSQLPPARKAVEALLAYVRRTQKQGGAALGILHIYNTGEFVGLDAAARRNLELTASLAGKRETSLLGVLDHTRTPMGARVLRSDVEKPLRDPIRLENRLSGVEYFYKDSIVRSDLRSLLKGFPDIERMVGRAVYGRSNPREVRALGDACLRLAGIRELLSGAAAPLIQELYTRVDPMEDLAGLICAALLDRPETTQNEGGIIREGYHPEVDRLRGVKNNSLIMVADMETEERAATGIKNLKVGYNRVFGYYIEVTKVNMHLVPEHYIRKQTIANGERYITNSLKDMESTILSAQERLNKLESDLFDDLLHQIIEGVGRFRGTSRAIARLDVLLSHAEAAERGRYTRPVVDLSGKLEITEGRHPVVEKMAADKVFTPNDAELGSEAPIIILTGPNMAGKSTYMRQIALITIMAHIGSFVPARAARIGIVDRIFTRIGAHDDLAGGRSTFMVEMSEVADILKNATGDSLLILDEIGRGTSTYDGMAVARAVLERVAGKIGAKTLFATHYHELTELEGQLTGVRNFNVAVQRRGESIVFLHKIIPGGADDSFGVEVARLAGLPDEVVARAGEILKELEGK
ncbi:MAG: DNA mismatch repair protein MutS [Oscillospiraceae bacterium]|nr:DNA mismatch repair protein MutS [Oscillospiraceae bacterium]